MVIKIRCLKCFELVPKENIKFIQGVSLCPACLEYNNINFEVLRDLAEQLNKSVVNITPQMKEIIRKKEQERREKIKVFY